MKQIPSKVLPPIGAMNPDTVLPRQPALSGRRYTAETDSLGTGTEPQRILSHLKLRSNDESVFRQFLDAVAGMPAFLESTFLAQLLAVVIESYAKSQTANTCYLRYPQTYHDPTTLAQ